jgi:hypothetical protein
VGVMHEPVHRRSGEGLGHDLVKSNPEGWRLLETVIERRSQGRAAGGTLTHRVAPGRADRWPRPVLALRRRPVRHPRLHGRRETAATPACPDQPLRRRHARPLRGPAVGNRNKRPGRGRENHDPRAPSLEGETAGQGPVIRVSGVAVQVPPRTPGSLHVLLREPAASAVEVA